MAALMPLYDKCYLGTAGSTGGYGEPRAAYTYSATPTRCLVIDHQPSEDTQGIQLPADMVRIAFHKSAGVVASTRVRVYRRLRTTLATAIDYIVDGEPRLVRGRLVARCRRTNTRDAA